MPALEFTPRELLTGCVVNTKPTPEDIAVTAPTKDDIETQLEYSKQQQLDAYSHIVEHANEREAIFNRKIDESRTKKLVTFHTNDLVQIYRSDLDYTFRTEHKMLPKWGQVRRVVSRDVNSYKLASLGGLVLKGRFSARRLRKFKARPGTSLDTQQKALEAATQSLREAGALTEEEEEDVPEEGIDDDEEAPGEAEGTPEEEMDGTGEDSESPQGGDETGDLDEDKSGEDEQKKPDDAEGHESEENDDGLPRGGWSAPGRLRTRKQKDRGAW